MDAHQTCNFQHLHNLTWCRPKPQCIPHVDFSSSIVEMPGTNYQPDQGREDTQHLRCGCIECTRYKLPDLWIEYVSLP